MNTDGTILLEKRSLCGSFLDSGVNELSVCSRLINLSQIFLVKTQEKRVCANDIHSTYESQTWYAGESVEIQLTTGWNKGINHKETILHFEHSDCFIRLNHSDQCVSWHKNEKQEILWEAAGTERMTAQYIGVFNDFILAKEVGQTNQEMTMLVHKLLFEKNIKKKLTKI